MINSVEKKIILERLQTMPPNLILSMGGESLDKYQIMVEVETESQIGILFVKMHMDYLRSL